MKHGLIRTVVGDTRPLRQYELAEFLALATEIQQTEQLDFVQAFVRAAEQLDELAHYYPYLWDSAAFSAGNWDAATGAIPF